MPNYEYRCEECGELSELHTSVEGYVPEIGCLCGGIMTRVFSVPAFHMYPTSEELMDKALRGEVEAAGMSREKTRKTAASMVPRRYRRN